MVLVSVLMLTSEPLYCRRPAFEMFATAVENVESNDGLVVRECVPYLFGDVK